METVEAKKLRIEGVVDWLKDNYVISPGHAPLLEKKDVYNHYKRACKQKGIRPTSSAAFGRLLHAAFPERETCRKKDKYRLRHFYLHLKRRDGAESSQYGSDAPESLRDMDHKAHNAYYCKPHAIELRGRSSPFGSPATADSSSPSSSPSPSPASSTSSSPSSPFAATPSPFWTDSDSTVPFTDDHLFGSLATSSLGMSSTPSFGYPAAHPTSSGCGNDVPFVRVNSSATTTAVASLLCPSDRDQRTSGLSHPVNHESAEPVVPWYLDNVNFPYSKYGLDPNQVNLANMDISRGPMQRNRRGRRPSNASTHPPAKPVASSVDAQKPVHHAATSSFIPVSQTGEMPFATKHSRPRESLPDLTIGEDFDGCESEDEDARPKKRERRGTVGGMDMEMKPFEFHGVNEHQVMTSLQALSPVKEEFGEESYQRKFMVEDSCLPLFPSIVSSNHHPSMAYSSYPHAVEHNPLHMNVPDMLYLAPTSSNETMGCNPLHSSVCETGWICCLEGNCSCNGLVEHSASISAAASSTTTTTTTSSTAPPSWMEELLL
ncbi:hypothetical protein QOT17_001788 [Balamuthia mandrillaris]